MKLNAPVAIFLLIASTAFAYVTADHLVDSLNGLVAAHPNVSKEWITLIVIPIISNAAEHTTAVVVARKGKFDLAMSVAVGSCIQIALFVIPVLILVAWGLDKPLTLLFDPLETVVSPRSSLNVADHVLTMLIRIGFVFLCIIGQILCRRWKIPLVERCRANWYATLLLPCVICFSSLPTAVYTLIALCFWNFPETHRLIQGQSLVCGA